jgi:vancomycin resistance protein YoaR
MDPEIQRKVSRFSAKKIVLFSMLAVIVLSLSFVCYSTYNVLSYDKVYNGVYINGQNVGGMKLDELKSLLKNSYQDSIEGKELTIKCKDVVEKVNFSDLGIVYNVSATAEEAYNVGRTGNIFERISKVIKTSNNNKKFDLLFTFDKKKAEDILEQLSKKTLINVKEAELIINENKVSIRSGHHGEKIDKDATLKLIEESIKTLKDSIIEAPIITTAPGKIDTEAFYKEINQDPADAVFKTDGKTYEFKTHQVGRSIDKETLISIADELDKTEDTEKELPVKFSNPQITIDTLKNNLFKDTLASSWTSFTTNGVNNANRGVNIRLAMKNINGFILGPGDVFSFNDVVGERTAKAGYKEAHTYVGGKVVDGIGGGICQVSTTLYGSVLFTDLTVLERVNHYFPVHYVPLGRDAAVSYGSVDFKFKNTSKWPVKIEGWVTADNKINFRLLGTKESQNKEIIITHKTTKTLNYETKYINDPNLKEGETRINTVGENGAIVDTYRIVKIDNKVVSETKLHTSYYHPLNREIVKGTKKVASSPVATSISSPTPIIQSDKPAVGVDDADNPPAKPTP